MKIQKNILISHDITSEEGRRLEKNKKPEKNELKKLKGLIKNQSENLSGLTNYKSHIM